MNRSNGGRHQSTLSGLWKSKGNNLEGSSIAKKRSRDTSPDAPSPSPNVPPALRIHDGSNNTPRWENNISLPNGPMLLLRGCVGGKKSSKRRATREALSNLNEWNDNVTFKIYGKECKMRRRICQFSTDGKISYSYSGLKDVVAPDFPQLLHEIKCQVESLICDHILELSEKEEGMPKNLAIPPGFVELIKSIKTGKDDGSKREIYNYCLLNHYRNGEEYMGYHSDSEASLDPHTPIASVSLGITRNFDIRPRKKDSEGKRSRVARLPLGDGDLLLMFYPMQRCYEHGIPVEKKLTGERINLTFRRIIT